METVQVNVALFAALWAFVWVFMAVFYVGYRLFINPLREG